MGVFSYSHEEDTYSFNNYEDDVPEEEKDSMVSELMSIQQDISTQLNEMTIGKTLKVIIDRSEGEYYIGRSEYDSPEVDQELLITSETELQTGHFYQILITESTEFDLFGEPV
jgi:ribosomal protein S12 methylthiotransferase